MPHGFDGQTKDFLGRKPLSFRGLQGLKAFLNCGWRAEKLLKNYAKIMIRQFPPDAMLESVLSPSN